MRGAQATARAALQNYGAAVGLAFQVVDDILDVTADSVTLGKTAGKDAASDKPTMCRCWGWSALSSTLRSCLNKPMRPWPIVACLTCAPWRLWLTWWCADRTDLLSGLPCQLRSD